MYDGICESLSDGLVLWSVIHSLDPLHTERPRKVCRDFRYHPAEELVKVVFPPAVVCQSVTVTFITDEVAEIEVIHTEIGKTFLHGQSLAEHHQAGHRKTFFACCSVDDITAKILEKCFVIDLIPHVTLVSVLEQCTITVQCVYVYVVHIIVFQQHTVVAVLKRVSYHCSYLTFCTMIIAFVVSSVSSLIYITVQVNRLNSPICLRYVNTYYLHVVYLDDIHIVTVKDIFIYLIAVDGVPKVIDNLLCIIDTDDLKTFLYIKFFSVFLNA